MLLYAICRWTRCAGQKTIVMLIVFDDITDYRSVGTITENGVSTPMDYPVRCMGVAFEFQ